MPKNPIKAFKWIYKKFNENPLTKLNKFSAYLRYIKFNLDQIIFKKERIYPFLKHTKFYAKKGMSGIVPNIYFGLHEVEEMGFLLHYLKHNDTFLDIGANVGAYTILASGETKCKSIAIEPIPSTFNFLKKNIKLNDLEEKVKLYNVGVSNKKGYLYFTNDKDSMNHVSKKDSLNSIKLRVHTVDDLINGKVNFIKIDVEGFEKFVLDGAKRILSENQMNVIQIELNTFGEKFNVKNGEIHNLLKYFGFKPCTYDPFKRTIKELETFKTDKFNTIYIKNIKVARQRVENATNIKIRNFSF